MLAIFCIYLSIFVNQTIGTFFGSIDPQRKWRNTIWKRITHHVLCTRSALWQCSNNHKGFHCNTFDVTDIDFSIFLFQFVFIWVITNKLLEVSFLNWGTFLNNWIKSLFVNFLSKSAIQPISIQSMDLAYQIIFSRIDELSYLHEEHSFFRMKSTP